MKLARLGGGGEVAKFICGFMACEPTTEPSFPKREAVSAKLSEVLFVKTLRAYIADLPARQTGWLAGARDAEVGKALALMHRNPAHLG